MLIQKSNIVTAFDNKTIGSKVTQPSVFLRAAERAIEAFDFDSQRVSGQGFIACPDAIPYVSSGDGRHTHKVEDYHLREHRGEIQTYLKRELAASIQSCHLVVYTREAYLSDPEVTETVDAPYVLVAVLASAGPKPELSPLRLISNLAGGNREALVWTADEIRAKAKAVREYALEWCTVADET